MLRILMMYLWLHGHEGYPFVFHQPLFKKVASASLYSLQQKGYQMLLKNWIFDDPFHKKEPLLVTAQTKENYFIRGCWGQPMLLFWKVVDETQMGKPRDHAARDISSKFSTFVPLRAIQKKPYHYETPCIWKVVF